MIVADNTFVSIRYTLRLDDGEMVDQSPPEEPMGFLFGSGAVIRGMEQNLQGMETGQAASFTVEPEEGYGIPNPSLWREIPRDNFPPEIDLIPGMGFEAKGPHGPVLFRVKSADEHQVVADFNHPLAGQRLHFDVTVVEVREPRAEELATLMQGCGPHACSSCAGSCGS